MATIASLVIAMRANLAPFQEGVRRAQAMVTDMQRRMSRDVGGSDAVASGIEQIGKKLVALETGTRILQGLGNGLNRMLTEVEAADAGWRSLGQSVLEMARTIPLLGEVVKASESLGRATVNAAEWMLMPEQAAQRMSQEFEDAQLAEVQQRKYQQFLQLYREGQKAEADARAQAEKMRQAAEAAARADRGAIEQILGGIADELIELRSGRAVLEQIRLQDLGATPEQIDAAVAARQQIEAIRAQMAAEEEARREQERAQEEARRAAERAQEDRRREAERIIESIRTPEQVFEAFKARVEELLREGLLTSEQAAEALAQRSEDIFGGGEARGSGQFRQATRLTLGLGADRNPQLTEQTQLLAKIASNTEGVGRAR